MTIHDIENMSAADIKAKRKELSEAVKAAPPDDLAARYIQARLDAKMRDEKLAEQGVTITSLNSALMAAQEKAVALEAKVKEWEAHADNREAEVERIGQKNGEITQQLVAETTRANKAEKLAAARRAVLADLMSRIAPLLAQE